MEGVVMATMGLNIKHYIALLLLSLATTMTMAQTETAVAQWQRQACELRLPAKFATLPWALTNCDATFHTTHAEGAWALSASAAMRYGLRVDGTTDERRDVQKGARAALSYLADLAQLCKNDEVAMLTIYLTPLYGEKAETMAMHVLTDMIRLAAAPSKLAVKGWRTNMTEVELKQAVDTDALMEVLEVSATVFYKNNPHLSTKAKALPQGTVVNLTESQQSAFLAAESQLYASKVAAEETRQEKSAVETPPVSKPAYITYKVKNGDTLSGIAARHHVTVAQLVKWNKLPNADRLSLGQTLKIYKK